MIWHDLIGRMIEPRPREGPTAAVGWIRRMGMNGGDGYWRWMGVEKLEGGGGMRDCGYGAMGWDTMGMRCTGWYGMVFVCDVMRREELGCDRLEVDPARKV